MTRLSLSQQADGKGILRLRDKAYNRFIHSALIGGISGVIPDSIYLSIKYKLLTGQMLHLRNPVTFNEKIQWLKLYDRNPLYCRLVDKLDVKDVMKEWIGEQYLIPTLRSWDRIESINFEELPEQFVMKTTHDSGGIVICRDKKFFDTEDAVKKLRKSYKRNYYEHGREWPYKNLKPRIIAEKYLMDESGNELKDYKVFCFSGKPRYIQVDFDRFTDHHRNFYSTDWEYVPFTTLYPTNPERKIKRPEVLDELLWLSRLIAARIGDPPFVRLDFYIIGKKIYFGEVTFYHGSGTEKFTPESYNIKLGNLIDIDKIREAKF